MMVLELHLKMIINLKIKGINPAPLLPNKKIKIYL